ncbi:MAG: beta-propeller domain-containing protein [Spirochaetales bacterium]|nr:beta-propeller domain-containing protein [Spirochaetales bacterium]
MIPKNCPIFKLSVIVLFLITIFTGCDLFMPSGGDTTLTGDLIKFNESGEIVSLNEYSSINSLYEEDGFAATDSGESAGTSREVVEPDIFKIEGDRLYLANTHNGLIILDITNKETPRLLGKVKTEGTPYEMYLSGNEVILLLSQAGSWDQSRVMSIDISNPESAQPGSSVDLDGYIVDNRLVDHILYVVTNDYSSQDDAEEDDNTITVSSLSNIYSTLVTAIDINSMSETGSLSVSGYSNAIHVTEESLYTSSSSGNYWDNGESLISRYDISDGAGTLTETGSFTIRGAVADRFKMDEYDGYFRCISYDWNSRTTIIYSIDWAIPSAPVCHHEPLFLAEGERLFGTRFGDDFAYVVTFLQTDPLYVIKFTNPDSPEVIGELAEIPGWSDHIEIIGDKLFTLGVDDVSGWKVKVSYFDVSTPESPDLIDSLILGDNTGYSFSMASWDYKRINFQEYLEAWAIPFSWYDNEDYTYKNCVSLIKIEPASLTEWITLPHPADVKRTMNVESNIVYTYSNEVITAFTIEGEDSYTLKSELVLAENITGIYPLSDDTGIKMVSAGWGSETYLKPFKLADYDSTDSLGQIEVVNSGYWYFTGTEDILSKGDYLYSLINLYSDSDRGTYIYTYKFSHPSAPVLDKRVKLSDNISYYEDYPQKQNRGAFSRVSENIYSVQLHNGIKLIQIINGEEPLILSFIESDTQSYFVADQICYINTTEYSDSWDDYYKNYLSAYDLTDPESPEFLFKVTVPGQVLYKESETVFMSYYISYPRVTNRWEWGSPDYCLISFTVENESSNINGILELEKGLSSYFSNEDLFAFFSGNDYLNYDYGIAEDMAWYPYRSQAKDLFTIKLNKTLVPVLTKIEEFDTGDSWFSSSMIPFETAEGDENLAITSDESVWVFTMNNGTLLLNKEVPRASGMEYGGVYRIMGENLYEAEGFGGIVRTEL